MKDIFLPPGVQMRLFDKLGRVPRRASDIVAEQIERLWRERNNAPEYDLDRIDRGMKDLIIEEEQRDRQRAQDACDRSGPYVNPID
jgi:hypothetical protein